MAFPPAILPKYNRNSFSVKISSEAHLFPKQKTALDCLCDWFGPESETREQIALISMPTGSGKTGVMSCLPYFLGSIGLVQPPDLHNPPTGVPLYKFDKPVLVIAPGLTIAKQLEEQLSVSQTGGINEAFLIKRNIVPVAFINVLPTTKKIESTAEVNGEHHFHQFDMIIANAQKFLLNNWEDTLPDNLFRLVIIDEAHHHPADTWLRIVNKFKQQALVVFFTATPYRGDKKEVLPNTRCYHLPLKEAIADGIIRQPDFVELTATDVLPIVRAFHKGRHQGKDITDMRRMAGILQKVKEVLEMKNQDPLRRLPGGIQHMAMAIACDINQANLLLELWRRMYPELSHVAKTYHSLQNQNERKTVMSELRNNALCLVIVVDMLLEGFDYPPISVSAITYKIGSPVRFVQFVGRAQRIYRAPEGSETNGTVAEIITHHYYEQKRNFENFEKGTFIPPDEIKSLEINLGNLAVIA